MACFSPLNAFKGKSTASDKVAVTFRRSGSWRGVRLDLPCGQCVGCRLERSRQWAVRCMHEASLHEDNSFLTLTYDDDHLPRGNAVCVRCKPNHVVDSSVCTSHFQDFMKRLRKSIAPRRVRYYHCGEYGEQFARPHYHALLFGYASPDRKFFSSKNGNSVFTSDTLSRLWPHGFSVEGDVTFDSAAYVARYVMKKVTGERAQEHYQGRKPEYTTMSRRPGIGKVWYDRFKGDVYPLDRVVVNGRDTRPPRFYDTLLGREDRSSLELIKIKREEDSERGRFHRTVDGIIDEQAGYRLRVKEEVKKAEITTLVRPLEGVI